MLPGNPDTPILYHVERARDGKSYATRIVIAKQRGKDIFSCMCSFNKFHPSKFEHQATMPNVPPPESLPSRNELFTTWIERDDVHDKVKRYLERRMQDPYPIDLRATETPKLSEVFKPKVKRAYSTMWMRANAILENSNPFFHQCVVAYSSDYELVRTSIMPYGVSAFTEPKLTFIASLDHSIWFHSPFRADEWLLYEMESPRMANGRAFATGRIFTRDGRHVASVAQEGVVKIVSKV